jgi:stage II sporulation protein AA (anti-sigma F factor antagonist)
MSVSEMVRSFFVPIIKKSQRRQIAMAMRGEAEGRRLTLSITGEVDHHQVGRLMGEMESRIDLHLPNQLVMDLGGVSFMDSSGIALLLRGWRRVGELGGSLQVVQVPEQAYRVLRAAGLERMMEIGRKEDSHED